MRFGRPLFIRKKLKEEVKNNVIVDYNITDCINAITNRLDLVLHPSANNVHRFLGCVLRRSRVSSFDNRVHP